jgi:hypothetical protein
MGKKLLVAVIPRPLIPLPVSEVAEKKAAKECSAEE